MKKIFTLLCFAGLLSSAAFAQDGHGRNNQQPSRSAYQQPQASVYNQHVYTNQVQHNDDWNRQQNNEITNRNRMDRDDMARHERMDQDDRNWRQPQMYPPVQYSAPVRYNTRYVQTNHVSLLGLLLGIH